MTRQAGIYGITALVGLAVGLGFGVLITKQKVSKANETIAQLKTEQTESQRQLSAASTELSRVKNDVSRFKDEAIRLNSELVRVKAESERMKAAITQGMEQGQGATPAAAASPTVQPAAPGAKPSAAAAAIPLPAGVREYTIAEGDSLWDIAAAQLGKGTRYEEIIKLNPGMTKNTTLKVGSKIKIPAK